MGNETESSGSVLLVGETDQHGVVEGHLSEAGVDLFHTPDLVAALESLDSGTFDCLLLAETDRTSGEVVERLRRAGHTQPVVALADTLSNGGVTAVASTGDPAGLVARVETTVADHRFERERAERRRLRDAVDDARDAALAADTTDAALGALCRTLVDSDRYAVAWVGRYDESTAQLEPIAAAGLPLGHLATVSVTETDSASTWALETGAVAVEGTDTRSTLAVPLGDPPSAILHVAAARSSGVSQGERHLLATLGTALGSVLGGGQSTAVEDGVTVLGDALGHELGNHLEIALTHLELARERGDDVHFDHVAAALDRMTALADESRLLARGDVEPEPVDLEVAASGAWEAVETDGASLDTRPGIVDADPDLLGLVLENLFRNAVEHGGDGVTVRVGSNGTGFAVADDGPGIPPEEREAVLEWGYTTSGTGVGLGIVKLVANRHGWSVEITESQDGGAQFEFEVS